MSNYIYLFCVYVITYPYTQLNIGLANGPRTLDPPLTYFKDPCFVFLNEALISL